jgi:hypothetical protein
LLHQPVIPGVALILWEQKLVSKTAAEDCGLSATALSWRSIFRLNPSGRSSWRKLCSPFVCLKKVIAPMKEI